MDLSYKNMATNPLRKASLQLRSDEQKRQMELQVARMRGALPDWSEERFILIALHTGKRCILWDDEGAGFCLWLRWDWASNTPAKPEAGRDTSNETGWYQDLKSFFKAPLLDPSVEDGQLADWIDSNTMRCHKNLLPLLAKVKRNNTVQATDSPDSDAPEWVLDDGK
jgi:hypothetical protein